MMASFPPEPGLRESFAMLPQQRNIVMLLRGMTPYWADTLDWLARAWGSRGRVVCIFGESGADPLHPWETDAPQTERIAEYIHLPPSGKALLGTIWPSFNCWELLDEIAPEIVICHEYSPYSVIGGLAWAKWHGVPSVLATDTGPVQRRQFTPQQRLVHALVHRMVDGFIARTQDAVNQSVLSRKPAVLAPHAVDVRGYRCGPFSTPPRRLLQVGSLIPRKGVDLLLKAFARARETRADIELVLAGAGDHESARRLSSELGISSAVATIPFLQPNDLLDLYAASDAFTLASRFDSYGVVTHEAAAASLPLVISRHAGSSVTLVQPGVNGFTVDPVDAAAYAQAILSVLDPANHAAMSAASRRIAEDGDIRVVAKKIAQWLEQFTAPLTEESVARSSPTIAVAGVESDPLFPGCRDPDATSTQRESVIRFVRPGSSNAMEAVAAKTARDTWGVLDRIQPDAVLVPAGGDLAAWVMMAWAFCAGKRALFLGHLPTESGSNRGSKLSAALLARVADDVWITPPEVGRSRGAGERPRRTPFRVFYAGNIGPVTSAACVLAAFALATRSRPDLELLLAGPGNHAWAREEVGRLGIDQDSVDVRSALLPEATSFECDRSDIFVLLSDDHTSCRACRSAVASGLPVVAGEDSTIGREIYTRCNRDDLVVRADPARLAATMLDALEPERHRQLSALACAGSDSVGDWLDGRLFSAWLETAALCPGTAPRQQPRGWLAGAAAFLMRLVCPVTEKTGGKVDYLETNRRDVVFLNRYAPFYRDGLFRRIAAIWSTRILFSGKTLGGLLTASDAEAVSVPSLEIKRAGRREIVWLAAERALWRTRPRVVITELSLSLLSTFPLLILRRALGFRLVFWTHGFQDQKEGDRRLSAADAIRLRLMKAADAVVFYNSKRKADVLAWTGSSDSFFVAPNALDTTAYLRPWRVLHAINRDEMKRKLGLVGPMILVLGRLVADKEVMLLPDFFRGLRDRLPQAQLVIIGGGPLESPLRRAFQSEGTSVVLTGAIFDRAVLAEWIYAAEAMLCPGYVGLNVVDSLCMGTPVFTRSETLTRKRHSPEISYVHPGKNGIMSDSDEELISTIASHLQGDSTLAWSRTKIRRRFLEECSPDIQFQGMSRAIEFCLQD